MSGWSIVFLASEYLTYDKFVNTSWLSISLFAYKIQFFSFKFLCFHCLNKTDPIPILVPLWKLKWNWKSDQIKKCFCSTDSQLYQTQNTFNSRHFRRMASLFAISFFFLLFIHFLVLSLNEFLLISKTIPVNVSGWDNNSIEGSILLAGAILNSFVLLSFRWFF